MTVETNIYVFLQHKCVNTIDEVVKNVCRLAMKESKGRMNPSIMNRLLSEKLKG